MGFLAELGPATLLSAAGDKSRDPRLEAVASTAAFASDCEVALALREPPSSLSPGVISSEVLVAGVAAECVVVAWSREGSLGRPPSVLDLDVLDVVRVRCDLAAAAASLA